MHDCREARSPRGISLETGLLSYLLRKRFAVDPGAAEPLGTSFTWMASRRYEYPAVPAPVPASVHATHESSIMVLRQPQGNTTRA